MRIGRNMRQSESASKQRCYDSRSFPSAHGWARKRATASSSVVELPGYGPTSRPTCLPCDVTYAARSTSALIRS